MNIYLPDSYTALIALSFILIRLSIPIGKYYFSELKKILVMATPAINAYICFILSIRVLYYSTGLPELSFYASLLATFFIFSKSSNDCTGYIKAIKEKYNTGKLEWVGF